MSSALQISLRDIPDDGSVACAGSLDTEFLGSLAFGDLDLHPEEGGRFDLILSQMGGVVEVEGEAGLALSGACVSCLVEIELELLVSIRASYLPRPPSVGESRHELDENNGIEYYTGNEIDLREGLREQIVLAVPEFPRCRQDCQGLCPQCGADLNGDCCEHSASERQTASATPGRGAGAASNNG